MRNIAIFIAPVLFFLTSCAQVPKEQSYLLTYQHKMQASEHWNKLAKEVAEKVKLKIGDQKDAIFIGNRKEISESVSDHTPFSDAMRTLLTTALQQYNGLHPTLDKNSPYKLVWEVQPVHHYADRKNGWSGLPAFILLDIPQFIFLGENDCSLRTKPCCEVIVNFELLNNEGTNQRSLLRHTRIFYVNYEDIGHYPYNSYSVTSGLGSKNYTMTTNQFEAIKVP